jgi:OmpA-OmpF porin, OOP family
VVARRSGKLQPLTASRMVFNEQGNVPMCQPKRWWLGLIPLALLWFIAVNQKTVPIREDLTKQASESLVKTGQAWAKVGIDGRDATLTGVAPAEEAPRLAATAADTTNGVRLVNNTASVLAVQKPWLWSAVRDNAKITLGGFVPDEATRARIKDDAAKAVPGAQIVDEMKVARGPSSVYPAAITHSLAQLARLPDGKANLSDNTLTVTGTAPSLDVYQAALGATKPAGTTDTIGLPTVKPYVWQAVKAGSTITLTGLAPSADAKAKIAEAAKAGAPNATVVDQLRLAAGAPAGFDGMTTAAFGHLSRLVSGTASLTDAAYTITGAAPSLEVQSAVNTATRGLPQGFNLASATITAPTINPYTWQAVKAGTNVVVSGYVPDAATKDANVAAIRTAVPNATVTDQQVLGSGAPNGFAAMASYAIRQLGTLANGTASLSGTTYTLVGDALSQAVRNTAVQGTTALPPGFTLGRADVTAPAPPPPPAPAPAPVAVAPPPAPVVVTPPPPPPTPVVTVPTVPTIDVCQQRFNEVTDPILFDTDRDTIRSVSYVVLGRLAGIAQACPTYTIEIGAHTDTDGTPAYNQDLSQRRAQAVRDWLVREGVAGTNLKPIGYGETKPIAPNDTPANKQKNRRVEFTVKQ